MKTHTIKHKADVIYWHGNLATKNVHKLAYFHRFISLKLTKQNIVNKLVREL